MVETSKSSNDRLAPNSAPLPAKFSSSALSEKQTVNSQLAALPHNLLRLQLQKKSSLIDCDTSSAASTAEATSPPIMQNRKHHPSSRDHPVNKLKLALPLKQRLQIVADSSQDDSSSSDGTPQRRILHEDPR